MRFYIVPTLIPLLLCHLDRDPLTRWPWQKCTMERGIPSPSFPYSFTLTKCLSKWLAEPGYSYILHINGLCLTTRRFRGKKISAPNVKRLRSVTLYYKTFSPEQHNKRIHEPIHNMVYSSKKNKTVYSILLGLYYFFIDSEQKQLGRGKGY